MSIWKSGSLVANAGRSYSPGRQARSSMEDRIARRRIAGRDAFRRCDGAACAAAAGAGSQRRGAEQNPRPIYRGLQAGHARNAWPPPRKGSGRWAARSCNHTRHQ